MKVAVFGTKSWDRHFLAEANGGHGHEFRFLEAHLTAETAPLAEGMAAVCVFVNDTVDRTVLRMLQAGGTKVVALRCAGFNNVDLEAAAECGITVVRVPAYSPHAVAEHAVALILALNRRIHRAFNRVREGNFDIEGLLGFDLNGRTVGVVGTGRIGAVFAGIMKGFGCSVKAYDPHPNRDLGLDYTSLEDLLATSDIVSLHCPLTPDTHHLINAGSIRVMKPGAMLINTSRGALIDTPALIAGLKSGHIAHVGLDVYEEEADLFFENLSNRVIQDDVFTRLLTFPNVLITGHQAFFTEEALRNIAGTTVENLTEVEKGGKCGNEVGVERKVGG